VADADGDVITAYLNPIGRRRWSHPDCGQPPVAGQGDRCSPSTLNENGILRPR
jgi:hypothetical protein